MTDSEAFHRTIHRGDDEEFGVAITVAEGEDEGEPANLAGLKIWLTSKLAKRYAKQADAEALYQAVIELDDAGQVVGEPELFTVGPDGPGAGILRLHLPAELTATFAPGQYRWDVQVRYPVPGGTRIKTILTGEEEVVEADVTRATGE